MEGGETEVAPPVGVDGAEHQRRKSQMLHEQMGQFRAQRRSSKFLGSRRRSTSSNSVRRASTSSQAEQIFDPTVDGGSADATAVVPDALPTDQMHKDAAEAVAVESGDAAAPMADLGKPLLLRASTAAQRSAAKPFCPCIHTPSVRLVGPRP